LTTRTSRPGAAPETSDPIRSDPIDAYAAARAVRSGRADDTPQTGDGTVEVVRTLRVARDGAVEPLGGELTGVLSPLAPSSRLAAPLPAS